MWVWEIHGARVTETTVRRALMKAFQQHLPEALTLRHEDQFTAGIPDLSVHLNNLTSWWEIKYANPLCHTTKIQQYMCEQLNTRGFLCQFIVFRRGCADKWPRQIRVCSPRDYPHWKQLGRVVSSGSFDYQALCRYIKEKHTCTAR